MYEKFLVLDQVSAPMTGGGLLLDGINLTIGRGEQWAVTGPSGSGKTALAHLLTGKIFYTGRIEFFAPGQGSIPGQGSDTGYKPRIAIVEQQHRFKNLSGTKDLYYQQRFNSYDSMQTITVEQELKEYGVAESGDHGRWAESLGIRHLLSKPLIQLSNGENKRVQLAIALASAPELLVLDNPFLGLDTDGRATLHGIIGLLATSGIQLLLITGAQEIPAAITHIARLEKGRLTGTGKKEDGFAASSFAASPQPGSGTQAPPDRHLLIPAAWMAAAPGLAAPPGPQFSIAVKMVNTTVRYAETTILKDINWDVKKGERWSVSGPNGAGKSTLLSLITADNPQAYANEIWLFDRRRGTGESIWDIKQKIGFVSPELHLYFDPGATCYDVIASGLFDTIGLFRSLSPEQEEKVALWMQWLSIGNLPSKRLMQLSTGQQRMALLARALIKNPALLILDEPCQGLDEEQSAHFKELIGALCQAFGTTLIYVSHYSAEIPSCVDRHLRLENGAVAQFFHQ